MILAPLLFHQSVTAVPRGLRQFVDDARVKRDALSYFVVCLPTRINVGLI